MKNSTADRKGFFTTLAHLRDAYAPYVFLSPFIILFLAFTLFPMLFSFYLSFHAWNPVKGLSGMEWVGFENYIFSLTDPLFWKSVKNTLLLAVISGVPQHVIGIPLAFVLVRGVRRMRHLFSSCYFVPFITSSVAVTMIFFTMYSPESGIINQALKYLANAWWSSWCLGWLNDYFPIFWLDRSVLIKPAVALVVIWKYTGFNTVIYMTGLMTVPEELYEAAELEGAGVFRTFWSISLPMLKPFIFFAVTMTIIGNLQLFEEPFILTEGMAGPGQSGLTLGFYLYRTGWEWLMMGSASAMSWLLFILIGVFTGLHFYFFGRQGMGGEES